MADRSLPALSGLNLAVAGMQTALGAFLPVFLGTHGWTHAEIGFALSLATASSMAAQIPGGALVDAVHHKRIAVAVCVTMVAMAALIIARFPTPWPVLAAQIMQGMASAVLIPAIAAITLALSRHDALGERFGKNVRFAALGSMAAAAAMGVIGTISHRATLYAAVAIGLVALLMLRGIHSIDLAAAPTRTAHRTVTRRDHPPTPWLELARNRSLLIFAGAMALFQLGNAALLPIASNGWTALVGWHTDLIVAAAIILPQALVAMLSPSFGRVAETHGRRLVLLLGFGAMPLRAILFALDGNPYLMVAWQALDGITGAAFGVMIPLVIADITHRTGRFNLAMGMVALVGGIGAVLGNPLAGWLADRLGENVAFVGLAAAGLAAFLVIARWMPETREDFAFPTEAEG